jgi:predicted acylesterase/phospholipase RssA
MEPTARSHEAPGTQLRIAMGMRGGVSLAVWMGGACSEVDRLRHSLDDDAPQDSAYRWLLEAGGHTSVAVDVLAGASAGGLNSVLMSCSVAHGMRFDGRIRDLWLRLGDLGALVRRDGGMTPASLLDGDAAFYGALAKELRSLVPAPGHRTPRLDTILTCTIFSPAPRTRYQDLGPPIVEKRNRAWFRFRSRPAGDDGAESDFGSTADDLTGALDLLAYAARATSSFPGAFEPASIGFAPDSHAPADVPSSGVPLPPTHYGVYSESRPRSATDIVEGIDRDHVIDGGVLDNIPLAWAVRSIAAAPADCPVDRWLLYLQPVPFAPPREEQRSRPRTFDTVRRARQLKGGTEALADDLDELERLRRDAERRRGFQQVLEYALGQVPEGTSKPEFLAELCERGLAALGRYRERAGAMEAGRIRALWTDPLPILGADPLSFEGSTRDPLPPSHACMLALLPAAGPELVLPALPPGDPPTGPEAVAPLAAQLPLFRSPQVLARTVSVLLDAARALGPDGLALKAALYEIREDIELYVARADRALAAAPAALAVPPTTPGALVEVIRSSLPGGIEGWGPRPDLWYRLVTAAQDLAAAAEKVAAQGAPGPQEARAFLGCLVRAAADTGDPTQATRAVLVAVELLTGPLRPDPLAETTAVRFHMISALNTSPLIPEPPTADERSADKLAGNQLSNFGAFLSARWRLNDWSWGRLDAAASLVDVLLHDLDPEGERADRLRTRFGVPSGLPPLELLDALRHGAVCRLHDAILREELPLLGEVGDAPPPADAPDVGPLPPEAALDPSALEVIGAEKPRDVAMRSMTRLPDAGRLVGVATMVVADGAAQMAWRQVVDLGRWAGAGIAARVRDAMSNAGGRKVR